MRCSLAKSKTGGETPVQFSPKTSTYKIIPSAYPALRWLWQWKYLFVETVPCAFIEAHPIYMFLS
jgi:hypothetical protein